MTPAVLLAFPEVDALDQLAARANAAHVAAGREFCRHVIIAGQALLDAKKIVKQAGGSWAAWLRENVHFSERTAQVYMQVARNPQRAADSLRQALGDDEAKRAKRAADLQAHIDLIDQRSGPDAADLRLCSSADLFASGIRPDAVITEPPHGAEHLPVFSALARACVDVPLVAVRMDQRCLQLPEVLKWLCAHLTYRCAVIRDNRQVLVFCRDDKAFEQAKARAVPAPTPLRPYLAWDEYLVQRLAGPGELVCDPFLQPATAIAALEFGRRFVGCSRDADVVADTRRRIGVGR